MRSIAKLNLMINPETITDVFFDLDHTLWDFEKNSALTFNKVFEEINLSVSLDDFLVHYNPINHAYWKLYRENRISQEELRYNRLSKTFEKLKFSISETVLQEISVQYINYLSTFTHLFEGTIDLLELLNKRYRLHIITNGFDEVQHFKMKNSGIHSYFEHIFTADKVGYKKPHPQIFIEALKVTASLPDHSLMIGDSLEADILGALAQGMHAIHFNSHGEEEHYQCPIVYSLDELKTVF